MLPVISAEPVLSLERMIPAFGVIASIFGECWTFSGTEKWFKNNASGEEWNSFYIWNQKKIPCVLGPTTANN